MEIPNFFKVNDSFATGAQPTVEGINILKKNGFTAIVNISPVSTPNYLSDEGKLTENLNMEYIHYPVDCSNLKDRHYKVFSAIQDFFHSWPLPLPRS